MEGKIVLRPLKSNQDHANPYDSSNHRFLVPPDRDVAADDKEGDSVTHGIGGDETAGLSVRKGEAILDEGKDG